MQSHGGVTAKDTLGREEDGTRGVITTTLGAVKSQSSSEVKRTTHDILSHFIARTKATSLWEGHNGSERQPEVDAAFRDRCLRNSHAVIDPPGESQEHPIELHTATIPHSEITSSRGHTHSCIVSQSVAVGACKRGKAAAWSVAALESGQDG